MNSGPGEPGKHNAKSLGGNSTMTTENPYAGTDHGIYWAQGYSAGLAKQADVIAEQIRSGTVHSAGDGCPTELRTTALAHAVDLAKDASFGQPLPHEIVESAEKFLAFLEGKTEEGDDK